MPLSAAQYGTDPRWQHIARLRSLAGAPCLVAPPSAR